MTRKTKQRTRKPTGPLQRLHDQAQANDNARPMITAETAQHGDYGRDGKNFVNRGGTPVDRWRTSGMISDGQMAAILHCQRLWQLTEAPARVTANLDRTVFGSPGDGNVREIEARSDLHRIRDGFPAAYWSVFENVVRFDEPAGLAGSKLAADDKQRRAKAHMVVCLVADMIVMREHLSY